MSFTDSQDPRQSPPLIPGPGVSLPPGGTTDSFQNKLEPTRQYALRGPQVEPEAAYWTVGKCPLPCVIPIARLSKITDDPGSDCYFPDFPTDPATLDYEIEELIELASMRDDPEAIVSREPGRERRGLSSFLQYRPQPVGAVYNLERDPILAPFFGGPPPPPSLLGVARGEELNASLPVVRTGRELARYFEAETPGLAHRHALNLILRDANYSPPRQAWIWAALDIAIYSALLAAWHYKWVAGTTGHDGKTRPNVSFRPRPWEYDHRIGVLFDRSVNATGTGDGRRSAAVPPLLPTPGTPRHPAYPSGHSTYSGAASELLSFFFPDYREEFDRLADNTGLARLWAGIHWRTDHVHGQRLGRCVARLIVEDICASGIPVFPDPMRICPASDQKPPAVPRTQPPSEADLAVCIQARRDECTDGEIKKRVEECGGQGPAAPHAGQSGLDLQERSRGSNQGAL